ncbi:MAG: hypothetical protein DWQ31_05715 [Planctomycetota bacterium]|nr:MAG: hypothetical protein DWQ31_05715 [Planctomycetota bacterium]
MFRSFVMLLGFGLVTCRVRVSLWAAVIFVSVFCVASSASAITLVSVNGAGSQQFELRTIDSSTGISTLKGGFTFDTGFWFPNTLNVDSASGQVYAVSSSTTLHEIDPNTAAIVNQFPLGVTNLQSLGNRGDGQLIGLNSPPGNDHTVRTIDPTDGSTVALNTFTFDTPNFWFNSTFEVDQANNRLYGLSAGETLYEWDATTGAVLNTTSLDVASNSLTFAVTGARSDGKLVGITTGGGSNQVRLIDPADPTGTTTQLLDFTFDSGGFFVDTFVPDPANDRFFVASSGPTLYEFSFSTGQILSTTPLDVSPQALAILPAAPSCNIGDVNCDGFVEIGNDILVAFTNFTGPGSFGKDRSTGDVHGPTTATTDPLGHDGDVDVSDILTIFGAFTGPPPDEGAGGLGGPAEAGDPSIPDLIYDAATGEVTLDADGSSIIGYSLQNATNSFLPAGHTPILAGVTTALTSQLEEAALTPGSGSIGLVFPTGLDLAGLQALLTVNQVSRSLGAPLVPFDLVVVSTSAPVVPEPATAVLWAIALLALGGWRWRARR